MIQYGEQKAINKNMKATMLLRETCFEQKPFCLPFALWHYRPGRSPSPEEDTTDILEVSTLEDMFRPSFLSLYTAEPIPLRP